MKRAKTERNNDVMEIDLALSNTNIIVNGLLNKFQ